MASITSNDSRQVNERSCLRETKDLPRRRSRLPHAVVVVALPWLIFFLMTCLFMFCFHDFPSFVWALAVLCACLAVFFLIIGLTEKDVVFFSLGFVCLAAVCVGVLVGDYIHDEYMDYYWRLSDGSEYYSVNPSLSSDQTPLGGVYNFLNGSFVDDKRTLGFVSDGDTYCIAPVALEGVYSDAISFWASGIDCCELRFDFRCGQSRAYRAITAVSQRNRTEYFSAIDQAISVYGLSPVDHVQIVKFVDEAGEVVDDVWTDALYLCLSAEIVYLMASLVTGALIMRGLASSKIAKGAPILAAWPASPK